MKRIFCLVIFMTLLGCKTKTVSLENSREIEKNSFQKHFDSLVQLSLKLQLNYNKNQSLVNTNWILTSVPVLDSVGNRKPLNYKHYIDGKLAEEIFLEAGELSQSKETKHSNESEHKDEVKSKNVRIESDVGSKSKFKKSAIKKAKKAETKGFQFGFYLWLLLLIVIIIILRWVSNKFKLPDKFMALFN